MKTIDFLGFYFTMIWVKPGSPIIHRYDIYELDGKCRLSVATFVRLWPMRIAAAFGRWRKSGLTEEEMFRTVFTARNIDLRDQDGEIDPRFLDAVRDRIAEHAQDADDEWRILEMLDLDS